MAEISVVHDNEELEEDHNSLGEKSASDHEHMDTQPTAPDVPALVEQPVVAATSCVSCINAFPEGRLATLPCTHVYCEGCLRHLFRRSFIDEQLFPPRCCRQPIVPHDESVSAFLDDDIRNTFNLKSIEFGTTDRTYCSNHDCGRFLATNEGDTWTYCWTCETRTCTSCKKAQHEGPCEEDGNDRLFAEMAVEEHWQKCPNCSRTIELVQGCYHIAYVILHPPPRNHTFADSHSCPCGTQFCYSCAARWKTCSCPQWDEAFLQRRANDVVDRRATQAGVPRADAVAAAVRALRFHCEHRGGWVFHHGAGRGEGCAEFMPVFRMECANCPVLFYRQCTLNRL